MSRRSITKDERVLLAIYRIVDKNVDSSVLEEALRKQEGLSEPSARNIINLLAQTGFIRYRKREGIISITEKGIALCEELERHSS